MRATIVVVALIAACGSPGWNRSYSLSWTCDQNCAAVVPAFPQPTVVSFDGLAAPGTTGGATGSAHFSDGSTITGVMVEGASLLIGGRLGPDANGNTWNLSLFVKSRAADPESFETATDPSGAPWGDVSLVAAGTSSAAFNVVGTAR